MNPTATFSLWVTETIIFIPSNKILLLFLYEHMSLLATGLFSIVPDHLLTVFDENELELAMCGSSHISLDDMKTCADTSSFSPHVSRF